MRDELPKAQLSASPYSTGGGGTRLEHRLGAVYLVRLLTGNSVSELRERVPDRIAFQQSSLTTVDDIVLTAPTADGHSQVRLDIAVRRTPKFVRSDKKTNDLVLALVRADLAAERSSNPLLDHRLAIAVSGRQSQARQVNELAEVARGQVNAEEFFNLVNTPGKFATSARLVHLRDMVAAALTEIDDRDTGTAEDRCWSLLRRLWILEPDLEAGHEADWAALIDDLKPVALGHSHEAAATLRDRLEQLSGELARVSGAVDAPALRRRLHGEIIPDAHVPPAGWTRLLILDKEARCAVTRTLAGLGSASALTLPRQAVRDELRAAIAPSGELIVKGDSGVGKSALVMDAIEPEELGADCQAIAVNLRHLPTNQLELLELLSNPLDELVSELTAPERFLVIDGAEAAAEKHGEVFSHLLRCARNVGMRVVAIAATEGAGAATQLMKAGAGTPREYVVPGLDDEEIMMAAAHFPALQRLANDPRGRELLRRPIIIDLLGRAGDPGLPLSESEALDHIWQHLVRNGERYDAETPDARERVMMKLADHALRGGDVDSVLVHLDATAVDGLRRSGVIHPRSQLPWKQLPEFKHDLLRAFSVARCLLSQCDPAAALAAMGAPRWTLPSARLACQIVLSAPDEPLHPRAGRFAQLQASFDTIAKSAGERWADVPTEALLTVRDSPRLLEDAWPSLVTNEAHGLARMIRVLHGRHRPDGLLDASISEPVITRLLTEEIPYGLAGKVDQLISDWLRVHALRGTPEGHPIRVLLRGTILRQCAAKEHLLDEQEAARQAELAARTPEEVAADEDRRAQFATHSRLPLPRRRRRRPASTRYRPYQWIDDAQIEQLALLGSDLGADGAAVLRRIAEDEPHSLDHAIESPLVGHSLAAYDSDLLIELAAAYYIEDYDEDDHCYGGFLDDGIRDHRSRGGIGPLARFTYGPFLAIFRSDYRGGVAFLNRMLNHAARHRLQRLSKSYYGSPIEEQSEKMRHTLSITGVPREYVGDIHVWLWYRGTGVGPYPCMSALQALEFVTEEFIRADVPPERLTALMLKGAENLAMPALALGILVRHLERAGSALDAYLIEPRVWEFEFSRVVSERSSGFAARSPELEHPERRGWSLAEVSMMLALQAEGDRGSQLKTLGQQLEVNARSQIGDDSSPAAREYLAAIRRWSGFLDQDRYELQQQGDQILIQPAVDPEVQQVLADSNADLRRSNDAIGLIVRHAYVRDNGSRAPDITDEALSADLATARDLLDNPPDSGLGRSPDGPVAVAASAIELHLTGRANVSEPDLVWSATVLLQVAAGIAEHPSDLFDDTLFCQGADRSAARALPFLLLPAADQLRRALEIDGPEDINDLTLLSGAIATRSSNEARLAYARGLDAIWATPCDLEHLYGRCHHRIALDLVTESFLDSVVGPWDPERQRCTVVRLDPPNATSLDGVEGKDISLRRLAAAIRATGSAAISSACCRDDARQALDSLLAAHQRAMLSHEHGYVHSQSDSLVAARAALWQAIDGRDDVVFAYLDRYLDHPQLLSEGLQAIAVAGEEKAEAGEHAHRLWPQIMDRVLDSAETNPGLFTEHTWGDYAEAHLIPNRAAEWGYLTVELSREPYRWRNLLSWSPQVERWLGAITGARMSIDHLVIGVRELDEAQQVESGLRWIERIVQRSDNCANTFTLPEWLHERRPDIVTDDQRARWQRVVDLLVVAGDSRVADLAD